jgi:DNA-directed RNA polymerase beta' subunit
LKDKKIEQFFEKYNSKKLKGNVSLIFNDLIRDLNELLCTDIEYQYLPGDTSYFLIKGKAKHKDIVFKGSLFDSCCEIYLEDSLSLYSCGYVYDLNKGINDIIEYLLIILFKIPKTPFSAPLIDVSQNFDFLKEFIRLLSPLADVRLLFEDLELLNEDTYLKYYERIEKIQSQFENVHLEKNTKNDLIEKHKIIVDNKCIINCSFNHVVSELDIIDSFELSYKRFFMNKLILIGDNTLLEDEDTFLKDIFAAIAYKQ